jgi:hypothetical protein
MTSSLFSVAVVLLAGSAAAAPFAGGSADLETRGSNWMNQWHPDGKSFDWLETDSTAKGYVDYGFNSTFGIGWDNATQIRLAYRGCDGMSVSFSTNDRQDTPQVRYGLNSSNLVSRVRG